MPSFIARPVRATSASFPIDEFLYHPDYRQIAAFFQGWVLMASLLSMALSSSTSRLRRWLASVLQAGRLDPPSHFSRHCTEKAPGSVDRLYSHTSAWNPGEGVDCIIISALNVSFAFSALANFLSLLTLPTAGGSFTCALVVALGGISGVCGRLLGLVTLCLQLRRLGIPKFEVCTICLAMISVIALAFAEYIIDTGVTVSMPQIDAYLCYSARHVPISSARSVVHTLLDVYVLSRLVSLIAPGFLSIRHRIRAFVDIRTIRVVSLLISELLLITPSVRSVGVVSDSALFTVGSLLVLASFSRDPSGLSGVEGLASVPPLSVASTARPVTSFISMGSRTHPSISNHPFTMNIPSSSTINIGPSTTWPCAPVSADSMSCTATPSMRTARVHVASKTRYTRAKYILTSDPGWMIERTLPSVMDGESLDHYFTRLEQLGIIRCHDEFRGHSERGQDCFSIQPEEKPRMSFLSLSGMGADLSDGADQHLRHYSDADYSATETRLIGPTLSHQSCFSLLKPVTSSCRPPLYSDKEERWLTFGGCSLSPTRRQRFSDQSHRFSLRTMSPVDLLEAHAQSPCAAYQPTIEERHVRPIDSHSEKAQNSVYGGSHVHVGKCHQVIPRRLSKARLRGPRPQPRGLPSPAP